MSRQLPGSTGREEIVIVGVTHRHAGEPPLQRVWPLESGQSSHGQAVPRDFDLLAAFNLVEQAQKFRLCFGCGHLSGHMVIIIGFRVNVKWRRLGAGRGSDRFTHDHENRLTHFAILLLRSGRHRMRDGGYWGVPNPVKQVVKEVVGTTARVAGRGAVGVYKAGDDVVNTTVAAGSQAISAVSSAIGSTIDFLSTCDWKKIAAGVIVLGAAAVVVGLGGYVIVTGVGIAAGATTVVGVVEGTHLAIQGAVIAGGGGAALGSAAGYAFINAGCGEYAGGSRLLPRSGGKE